MVTNAAKGHVAGCPEPSFAMQRQAPSECCLQQAHLPRDGFPATESFGHWVEHRGVAIRRKIEPIDVEQQRRSHPVASQVLVLYRVWDDTSARAGSMFEIGTSPGLQRVRPSRDLQTPFCLLEILSSRGVLSSGHTAVLCRSEVPDSMFPCERRSCQITGRNLTPTATLTGRPRVPRRAGRVVRGGSSEWS